MIYSKLPQGVEWIKPFVETENQSVTTWTQNLITLDTHTQNIAVFLLFFSH